MARGESSNNLESNGAIPVIESTLSAAADKLRNNPERKKQIKILGLNLGIAAADIITLKLGIGGSALGLAFGSTIFFLSVVGVTYGNYRLFAEPKKEIPPDELRRRRIIEELNEHRGLETFKETIDLLLDQIERLEKKKKNIREILPKIFEGSEITITKFIAAIAEVENKFYANMDHILSKFKAFDPDDFIRAREFSQHFKEDNIKLHDEYITDVKADAEDNEQILRKLNKVQLELSDLNHGDFGELEIDTLIDQIIPWYKKK